jgi:hypothetical protein
MAFTEEQARWVSDVFGVHPPDASIPTEPGADPQAIWAEAKEAVDAKLTALSRIMREVGDERLDAIAESGLFALTGGGKTVALMAALQDYNRSPDPSRAGALKAAAGQYRAAIDASPMATLLDSNPFGVDVALKQTLGGALERIEAQIG